MKKRGFRIGILVFFALISLSAASDCAGFLDDVTCVQACTPPKVNDVKSGKCIASRSLCEGVYFQPENICLFSCPPRTVPGMTFEKKKVCIPIDIPVLYPNAAKLNCMMPQYFDLINFVCASNTTACSGRFIPEIAACVSSCPDQLMESSFINQQNVTVNSCSVKPYVLPVECSVNQVRDIPSNTCLDSADNCVGFLIKDKALCVPKCPPESGTPITVENATYSVCTEKPLACNSTQIFDKVHETCLTDAASCVGYLIPEKRMCVDECPDFNEVKSISGANYKICVPCLFKDANSTCYEFCPPTMKQDNEKRICIEDTALSCSKYFVKIDSSCRDQCPYGTVANNESSPKTCIPCSQSPQGCPDQTNLCTQKLSADKLICGAECPNMQYSESEKDKPYQQCKQCDSKEKFVNLAGNQCVDKCEASQAGDRASRRCISADACTQYLFKENGFLQCGKQCPMNQIAAAAAVGNSTYIACSTCESGKFLDIASQTCVATCTIFDAKQTACLKSISECIGFISSDNQNCLTACATGQVFSNGSMPGQFLCADSCPTNRFLFEGKCLEKCVKGTYPDSATSKCVESSKCVDIVSLDGKNCVKSCDAGQFVQSDEKNMKVCKICSGKVSSDGMKCEKECASGDVFDMDQKKCLNSSDSKTCSGKIYSGDKKNCSNMCPKGSLQYTDASGNKSCLASISDCKDYVSSDQKKCVSACGSTEAVITQNSTRFCRICAFGATSDKSACQSADKCDAATQLFDIDSGSCVAISACASKLLSVDGLKCSTKCVYPEVNRPNVSTTQCYSQCGTDEIRVKDKGCVASTECDGYISAGSGSCVEECVHVREAIDSISSVPKTCKKCLATEIPAVVVSNGKKVIECQAKASTDTDASIATTQAAGMSDILGTFTKIALEQKSDLKDQVSSVSDTLEATMKSLKSNLELTDDEKKTQLKSYLANVKDLAKSFSQKVDQSATTTTSASSASSSSTSTTSSSDAPESQIILGSSEFQLITESLKTGNVFNVNFSLDNFLSASPSPLQTDPALLGASDLVSSTSSDISTLQAVNLSTNPYCVDAAKCSSYGLFSVEYTLTDAAVRRLSAADGKTFSTVYKVSAMNLSKTICVSYDDVSGDMIPAVATQADASKSTITCTFYSNSDLFLDSSCQYIDTSLCVTATVAQQQQSQPTSGIMKVFSLALLAGIVMAINL